MKAKKRVRKAIGPYLEHRGCEILDEGWRHGSDKVDYIVADGGCIAFVFALVSENRGEGIPDGTVDRKAFERLMAAYFAERPELAECAVRADIASMLILSDDRAVIRHNVNALSACGIDLRP